MRVHSPSWVSVGRARVGNERNVGETGRRVEREEGREGRREEGRESEEDGDDTVLFKSLALM